MQIVLVQAEIEQALVNYVNEMVNVKDGMEINIDLRATRGADGTTAVVDIVKTGSASQSAPKPQAVVAAPVGRPRKAEQLELDAPLAVAEPEPEPAKEVLDVIEPAKSEAAEAATDEQKEVAPAPKKSLFANLKKPVNEPVATE